MGKLQIPKYTETSGLEFGICLFGILKRGVTPTKVVPACR